MGAIVSIILELRRFTNEPEDTRRSIKSYSRFEETPDELVVKLAGSQFVYVGTKFNAQRDDRIGVLKQMLSTDPPGETAKMIRERWEGYDVPRPVASTVSSDLRFGYDQGIFARTGEGKKGAPYLYWIRGSDAA